MQPCVPIAAIGLEIMPPHGVLRVSKHTFVCLCDVCVHSYTYTHAGPRVMPFQDVLACEFLGKAFAFRLGAILQEQQYAMRDRVMQLQSEICHKIMEEYVTCNHVCG